MLAESVHHDDAGLRWAIRPEHTLGIFEAGISEPGEMDALARIIAPAIGLFTNIGPAHSAHFALRQREQITPMQQGLTADMGIFCEPQQTQSRHGLARA